MGGKSASKDPPSRRHPGRPSARPAAAPAPARPTPGRHPPYIYKLPINRTAAVMLIKDDNKLIIETSL